MKTWNARDQTEKAHHGRNKKHKKLQKKEKTMAKRSKPRASRDRKIFNVTARKTKAINLYSKPSRGGIRL